MNEVHAPYNFIPFSAQAIRRYDSLEELPAHDRLDSKLKSGEIHVTFKAKTPVFVSDGEKDHPDFYKNAEGQYEIPGSTVRGMLRETVQILGFGLFRPETELDDYQIFFREVAARKGSVKGSIHTYYEKEVMNVEHKWVNKKMVSIPKNVKAGYLCHMEDGYYIRPLKQGYYRVSRNHPGAKRFETNGKMPLAKAVDTYYRMNGTKVDTLIPTESEAAKKVSEKKWEKGQMLFTGKSVKNKNALYLFPQDDIRQRLIKISEDDVLSYQMDFEKREKQLGNLKNFWKLPQKGEKKPVFWVKYQGHLYFGMSLFLRVGYPHSIAEGISKSQREKLRESGVYLDYPYSMFGFAEKEKGAYRSRISVEGFTADRREENRKNEKRILSEPKPGYYPGYLKNGASYVDDEFELRGYKQYWMKEPDGAKKENENERIVSNLRPLSAGTCFSGTIHYKNLHEDELGLLLWAIRLESGCYHQIGMGKPYGFGCLSVEKIQLMEEKTEELYKLNSLLGGSVFTESKKTDAYIQEYKRYAYRKIRTGKNVKKLEEQPEIEDFLFLHRTFQPKKGQINTSYMDLKEYQNKDEVLPEIWEYRKRRKRAGE